MDVENQNKQISLARKMSSNQTAPINVNAAASLAAEQAARKKVAAHARWLTEIKSLLTTSSDFSKRYENALRSSGLPAEKCAKTAEEYLSLAMQAVRGDHAYKLVDYPLASFENALCKLAAMNLPYDPVGGLGWITPSFDRDNSTELTVMPGVRGMERQLRRSGVVGLVRVVPIREQDDLNYDRGDMLGLRLPSPRPNLTPDPSKPNRLVGFICAAQIKGCEGAHLMEYPVTAALHQTVTQKAQKRQMFMTVDDALYYRAWRKFMREIVHVYMQDQPSLMAMVATFEDQLETEQHREPSPSETATTAAITAKSLAETLVEQQQQKTPAATLPAPPPPPAATDPIAVAVSGANQAITRDLAPPPPASAPPAQAPAQTQTSAPKRTLLPPARRPDDDGRRHTSL
jgi:recombinational DNA repair protein RecT